MVDEKKIIESLSPIERKILPVLRDGMRLEEISEKSGCDKTTCLRALDFLKKKKLIDTQEKLNKMIIVNINGIYYLKKGLPERRLLNELVKERAIAISRIKEIGLNEQEVKIAVGVLKRKALVGISNGKVLLTAKKEEVSRKMLEEKFLELIFGEGTIWKYGYYSNDSIPVSDSYLEVFEEVRGDVAVEEITERLYVGDTGDLTLLPYLIYEID